MEAPDQRRFPYFNDEMGAAVDATFGSADTFLFGRKTFFGELALLAGSRRTAKVRATEPVQAMVFEMMYFRPFLIENPSVAVTLLKGVAKWLNAAQDRLDSERAWR